MDKLTDSPTTAASIVRRWAENTAAALIWAALGAATLTYPAVVIYWAGQAA